jgi:hypothetical protein
MWLLNRLTMRPASEAKLFVDFANTSVTLLGVLLAFFTVLIAARRYRLNYRQHVTESFSKALERLSSSESSVRVGAIYALEQIAHDNPETYYWPVIDTLCAYIREYSVIARYYIVRKDAPNTRHLEEIENLKKKISKYMISPELDVVPEDVLAAFRVIGRRKFARRLIRVRLFRKTFRFDYSPRRLEKNRRLNLKDAHLSFMPIAYEPLNYSFAIFDDADFSYSDLTGYKFAYAEFCGANFECCTLLNTDLYGTHVQIADSLAIDSVP